MKRPHNDDENIFSESEYRGSGQVKIFGLSFDGLPSSLADSINAGITYFLPDVIEKAEDYISKGAELTAETVFRTDKAKAKKIGLIAGDVGGYVIAGSEHIVSALTATKRSAVRLSELNKKIPIYQRANRNHLGVASLMTSAHFSNEVVAAAVNREMERLGVDLKATCAQAIGSAPLLVNTFISQRNKNAKRKEDAEYAGMNPTEAAKKRFENTHSGQGDTKENYTHKAERDFKEWCGANPDADRKDIRSMREFFYSEWKRYDQEAAYGELSEAQKEERRKQGMKILSGMSRYLGGYLGRKVAEANKDITKRTLALDMILELEASLKNDPESDRVNGVPLAEYVASIFAKHEENMGRNLSKPRRERIREVSEIIAGDIKRGYLLPQSLIDVVGGKGIMKSNHQVATDDEVRKVLGEVEKKYNTHEPVNVDEVLARDQISKEDLLLMVKHLKGEGRAVAASLLQDEVLEAAGMKPTEIKHLREQIHHSYASIMGKVVKELMENPPIALNAKETQLLEELSEAMRHSKSSVMRDALGAESNRETPLKSILRKAVVANGGSWVEHVVDKSLAHKEHGGSRHRELREGESDGMEEYRPHRYDDGVEGRHAARNHVKHREEEGYASRFGNEGGFADHHQKPNHSNEWGMRS